MIDPIPTATYRIQLREGIGFAEITAHLAHFVDLGISHLYLSPIFTASAGSTHGYDVTDPTKIEPELGGRAGFEQLAAAAHARGIGIILDIVPNHTAFTLENPWLQDVLKHGPSSKFARHFDIDWSAGRLALPILPEPFPAMLAAGRFTVQDGQWRFDDVTIPLAAGERVSVDDLSVLHEHQHWQLRHWESERDSITHRRFFNVTGLIGMRVELPEVFDDTHALILDLVRAGHVDGLRVDHIDGLADPAAYLQRLAEALPDTPVWVEKILVDDEQLPPHWPVAGTTGYEAGWLITRLLTSPRGLAKLDTLWRNRTGITEDFPEALARAKAVILTNELAAELHQLVALAKAALSDDPQVDAGPEGLREAVIALLTGMNRYRTYLDVAGSPTLGGVEQDLELIQDIVAKAGPTLRSAHILERLGQAMLAMRTQSARALALRFQQVSGALLAKAQEDTAGFRWTRYLPANEVGAEPAQCTITEAEANRFLEHRRRSDMTLTTSHDTKRSEDARARMIAISQHPEALASLVEQMRELDPDNDVTPAWHWYIAQSVLGIWSEETGQHEQRLADHMIKAMREAKETTFWTRPVDAVEAPAMALAQDVFRHWCQTRPQALGTLVETGKAVSLTQVALKTLMPGFPDIYRGCEAPYYTLTDPDSRLPVDWSMLNEQSLTDSFARDKLRLTRTLLQLRRTERWFFDNAKVDLQHSADHLRLIRSLDGRSLVLEHSPSNLPARGKVIWSSHYGATSLTIAWSG